MMPDPSTPILPGAPRRQLSLFDSTCIIVGIIIGAGIYEATPQIASNVSSAGGLLLVWTIGGVIALVGGLCYAELATAYPHDGGDYVFLTKAYGRRVGFLFAWAEYWIIRPGNVGMMAFVFGRFAHDLQPILGGNPQSDFLLYACLAILALTALNLLGVRAGTRAQNVLTSIKVLGLLSIVVVGLWLVPAAAAAETAARPAESADYRLALILVLFTYGGWNEMSYVAAEVRDPDRNIFRALLVGTAAIMLIYLAVNLTFVRSLGLAGTISSEAVAADVLRLGFGEYGGRFINLLICLSCLGAINGMLFTGSRVFYAAGAEHRLIGWLGKWHGRLDTPLRALLLQLAVTLALVAGFGWYEEGFMRLLYFTTPVFWFFATLVSASLFILRWRDPETRRPHRVVLYPVTPLLFLLSSAFLLYESFTFALSKSSAEAMWTVGILGVGLAVSLLDRPKGSGDPTS